MEREQAQEYRKKFYSGVQGGFQGAGGGSFSNAGDSHGYSVPSSSSSYTGPGDTGISGGGGAGVTKVYSPYNAADDPVLKVPTSGGGLKWGTSQGQPSTTSNVVSSTGQGGSTFNITNNNNINYNYGSNITAISSDGAGSVPTFHDLDKKKKEVSGGMLGGASNTLGYIGSSLGSVASGMSSQKGASGGSGTISSITKSLQTSKGLAQTSDSIKRYTGIDIHGAIGGKTAVQLAEERLQKEQEQLRAGGYGGNAGGYQGISIPLTPAMNTESNVQASSSSATGPSGGETLNKVYSKYSHQWGSDQAQAAEKKEEPKIA